MRRSLVQRSARSHPPPRRRCSDGSHSNMLSNDEGHTSVAMVGGLNCRSSRERGKPANIESLPDELLFFIFVGLPADYLYDSAMLVCRRWCRIIRSYLFINTHLQHSTYGLLFTSHEGHPIFMTATQAGLIKTSESSYKCITSIVDGCNGLVMEPNQNLRGILFKITNPATKQAFVLPSFYRLVLSSRFSGIAYAADSMEYKVVVSYMTLSKFDGLAILTVGVDKSWREVEVEHLSRRAWERLFGRPIVTEGFMHWVKGLPGGRIVVTLDVEEEILTVSKVPLHLSPRAYGKSCKYYLSTGRSLSLLVAYENFVWELWEMNPETKEWTMLVGDIKLGDQKKRLQQFACIRDDDLEPVGWVKFPEVLALRYHALFNLNRTCLFYNLHTHEINSTELPDACGRFSCTVHKNSLVHLS